VNAASSCWSLAGIVDKDDPLAKEAVASTPDGGEKVAEWTAAWGSVAWANRARSWEKSLGAVIDACVCIAFIRQTI